MNPIDTSNMFSLDNLHLYEADQEFVDQTLKLAKEAVSFLESHKWCKKVKDILFDRGIGYPFGVFFTEIEPVGSDVDNFVWVIVGDIPRHIWMYRIVKMGHRLWMPMFIACRNGLIMYFRENPLLI